MFFKKMPFPFGFHLQTLFSDPSGFVSESGRQPGWTKSMGWILTGDTSNSTCRLMIHFLLLLEIFLLVYDTTKIARVVSNRAPVGTHSLYHVLDLRSFALVCTCLYFVRRFALVLHFCALVSLMTLPKLATVKEYEAIGFDFCSNAKNIYARKHLWRKKTLQRVNLCIEPEGRLKLLL